MLVSTAVFAVDKDIHKLEDAYIEKSRKLTESYIAALKQLEVRVTKKGDLIERFTCSKT
jgi:acyl CoA:acetate/3-ketoacid CoA transferase alpha subunit